MKKKLLGAIFALAVMVAAGYGVNKSMQHDADLSDMALSNVDPMDVLIMGMGVGVMVGIRVIGKHNFL